MHVLKFNYFCRIVQAFDNIVESLIEFENFTNLSVNADDVLLRGERVINSPYTKCLVIAIIVSRYLETCIKDEPFLLLVCKVNRPSFDMYKHCKMFDFFSVLNASTTDTSMDKPVAETSSLSLPQNLAVFTNWTGH